MSKRFNESEFIPETNFIYDYVKTILKKNISNTQKQSYSNEFKQSVVNLLGLFGFEFCDSLMNFMGIIRIIKNTIYDIEQSKTYDEIKTSLLLIDGLLNNIGFKWNIKNKKRSINDEKNKQRKIFNLNVNLNDEECKTKININELLDLCETTTCVDVKTYNDKKTKIVFKLNEILKNIKLGYIEINDINEILINAEYLKFIKITEILYKSTLSENIVLYGKNFDIYNNKFLETYFNKYITNDDYDFEYYKHECVLYFKNIRTHTYDMLTVENEDIYKNDVKIVEVNITDKFYEKLSLCVLNYFTILTKVFISQIMAARILERTTRIQSSNVLSAILSSFELVLDLNVTEHHIEILKRVLL